MAGFILFKCNKCYNESMLTDIFFVLACVGIIVLTVFVVILCVYLIRLARDLKEISGKTRAFTAFIGSFFKSHRKENKNGGKK